MKNFILFCTMISALFARDICDDDFMIKTVNELNAQSPIVVDKSTMLKKHFLLEQYHYIFDDFGR